MRWISVGALVSWVAAAVILLWPAQPPSLEVWFLDVGQGDAILMRSPGGVIVLVDAGTGDADYSRGGREALRALREWGAPRVDLFVWTHPEADHIGGAETVLRAVPVGMVLEPGFPHPSEVYAEALRAVKERGVTARKARRGQRIALGDGVEILVLHPGPEPHTKANEASVVLRVTYGGTAFLLTGDISTATEQEIMDSGQEVRADLLKVAHHGGRASTSHAWLAHVTPRYAVISCGRDNRYGHPHEEVLERLRRRSVAVFRTDTDGSVRCVSDGRSLRIRLPATR